MTERPLYEVSEGRLGPRLEIRAEWTPAVARAASAAGVREVALGPRVRDLSFLREMPGNLDLSLLHDGDDLAPIHSLSELRRAYFANVRGFKIDFASFPRLKDCTLEWSSGVQGVFEARSLQRLFVNRLPKAFLPRLARLERLRDLGLLSCGAESLDVLRELPGLEHLRIGLFSKLRDNAFLSGLPELRDLQVQLCGGFSSLEALASAARLESLALEGVGPVESLRPLAGLRELRTVVVYGGRGPRLVDGDFSPMWELPKLERLVVTGKGGVRWEAPGAE